MSVHVNYLAVIVAAIANMVIGSLWYSPALFGKEWMRLTGHKMGSGKGVSTAYIMAAVVSLVEAFVLARFITIDAATTYLPVNIMEAVKVAAWVWVGFVATVVASSFIFEGRPMKLYQITVGYQLVSFLVMGAIIAAMG
jgi:hypothetical protein